MRNRDISKTLRLLSHLLDLHDEDPAAVKGFASAAFQVDRLNEPLATVEPDQIGKVAAIRKESAEAVKELLQTGTIKRLETLVSKTPAGILELFSLKGIGPKKIGVLWRELGIESPGELLYACRENRLTKLKGFGAKTQEALIQSIEFRQSGDGSLLYFAAEETAKRLISYLDNQFPEEQSALTGAIRRKELIVPGIDVVTTINDPDLQSFINPLAIPIQFHKASHENFGQVLFQSTASPEFLSELTPHSIPQKKDETEIFTALQIPSIIPELRNWKVSEAVGLIKKADNQFIQTEDIKGILHSHSTYSDGMNTLKEMAEACKEKGYEYFGICDHSKAAFYAGGLKPEEVIEQQNEIRKLNESLSPFKIFSGIESDILSDGSLDYPVEILETFDFVVASVHSNLKMQEEKAMHRLLRAIENPYTTILGHMTGRLLLSRPGYPVDHIKIIDACAANGVIIELNANPHRLDMDWSWIPYALDKGVMISINPDAHSIAEIDFVRYGVYAGRKGGLNSAMTFNTKGVEAVSLHFSKRRVKA